MKRILISRLSSLGDVTCTLPVAGLLKNCFPESHITWAVDPRFAAIVEGCRFVDEVIKVKPSFKPDTWPKFEDSFDAVLDLQGLLKSAIVIARSKSPIKLGYHWQREGSGLFTRKVLPDPASIHIVDQYLDVARTAAVLLGYPEEDLPIEANFGLRANSELMRDFEFNESNYIVMNAGAGWATKRWLPQSFAKVIEALNSHRIMTLLIGGKAEGDRIVAEEVMRECENLSTRKPNNMLGKTSVEQLIALLQNAKAHLGGDTGSTHIAAAVGIPAIGLYSITKPARSCPYGQMENCCYDPTSLAEIKPEDVLTRFEKLGLFSRVEKISS